MQGSFRKKAFSVTRTGALTVAFILGIILWNHIELPFLPHQVYSFAYSLQWLIATSIGLCWLVMFLWVITLAVIRFPKPSLAAAAAWYCIYLLYSKTHLSEEIPRVIFVGVFFVLFVCGLSWYIENRTASEVRDSRYSPRDPQKMLMSFWPGFQRAGSSPWMPGGRERPPTQVTTRFPNIWAPILKEDGWPTRSLAVPCGPKAPTPEQYPELLQDRIDLLIQANPKQAEKDLEAIGGSYNPELSNIPVGCPPQHWAPQIMQLDQMRMLLAQIDWKKDNPPRELSDDHLPSLIDILQML
jgi:hypothetical protein